MADFREFLQEGTFPERKALIRNFVQSIEIVEDEAVLTYTIPMPSDGVTSESASVLDFVQSGPPSGVLGIWFLDNSCVGRCQMMFSCLPHNNEHEWCNLRDFVNQYSELYGKAYRVVAFPELDSRNTKEPEVLLEAPGDEALVAIERKSVVQPLDDRYLAKHRNGHYLFHCFLEQLDSHGCDYSDTLYRLTVHERNLNDRRQKEVPKIAEQLAAAVRRDWLRIDESYLGIGGETPIPWQFRVVTPEEKDYDDPENGIVFTTDLENTLFESPEKVEEERLGYAKEFERQATSAAGKFAQYADCRKLFLVQFFGDTFGGVGDKEITEMVKSACLPEVIDEVWVARLEWVGLNESEILWEQIR